MIILFQKRLKDLYFVVSVTVADTLHVFDHSGLEGILDPAKETLVS